MATVFADAGRDKVTDYIDGTASAPANYYGGWGTGAGTAGKTDTTLFTETGTRQAVTESQPSANINRFLWTQTAGSSLSITNAGVFDASSTGTLFIKGDFSTVNLNSGDSIQFTAELTLTN